MPEEKEQKLREILDRRNQQDTDNCGEAQFMSYDLNSYEWVFKVPHYTKWDDESDEE